MIHNTVLRGFEAFIVIQGRLRDSRKLYPSSVIQTVGLALQRDPRSRSYRRLSVIKERDMGLGYCFWVRQIQARRVVSIESPVQATSPILHSTELDSLQKSPLFRAMKPIVIVLARR